MHLRGHSSISFKRRKLLGRGDRLLISSLLLSPHSDPVFSSLLLLEIVTVVIRKWVFRDYVGRLKLLEGSIVY